MIVQMKSQCAKEDIEHVIEILDEANTQHFLIELSGIKMIEVFDFSHNLDIDRLKNSPMVERVVKKCTPNLAAKQDSTDETYQITLGEHATFGGKKLGIIAGPCSVETQGHLLEIAHAVSEAGAVALRGGTFKPRTSPYSFQGLGEAGLEMLALAGEETGLAIVTEVMGVEHIPLVSKYADALQIGSRNMHNSNLLLAVGQQAKPVLLKRGWSATLAEFLMAAEYIMLGGNRNVILCERGIRTFEEFTRNTLSLAIVPEIKRVSRLPIIADPSHGTGRRHLVAPMGNAAIACGADGLIIEVHRAPEQAWCDGDQSLSHQEFEAFMKSLPAFAEAAGRTL